MCQSTQMIAFVTYNRSQRNKHQRLKLPHCLSISCQFCRVINLRASFHSNYNFRRRIAEMGCGVAMCVLQNREMLNLHKDSKSPVSTLKPQNQNIRVNISSSSLPTKKECIVEPAKTEERKEEKSSESVGKENAVVAGKQNTLVVQVKQKEVPKPEVKENQKVNESKQETREVNDRFNKFQKPKAAQPEKKEVPKPKPETKVPEKKQKTPIKTTRTQQPKQKQMKQAPKQVVKQARKQPLKEEPLQKKVQKVQNVQKQQVNTNVQKQEVSTGKRQSMNIEDIKGIDAVVNGKKAEESAVPSMEKKASSKNIYKNDISRKSLKIKKEMTPVDSLFLQSVITRQEEPVIESEIKETRLTPVNQSRVQAKPQNTRNLPPSRKGKNEPIQMVENLIEIDKNLDVQKVPKKASQNAIIPREKIVPAKKEGTASKIEEKTIKKISESRKVQEEEKKVLELKKKAEEESRKVQQQKRLVEAKRKIQLQEKKALEMQTSKLKKVYNV